MEPENKGPQIVKEGWIIVTDTLCQGIVPAWKDENEVPIVYDTKDEAYREIAQDMADDLRRFLDKEIPLEEVNWDYPDWVEECTIYDDGQIRIEGAGCIYNAKNKDQ